MNTQYTAGPWTNFGNLAMDSKGRTIAKACVLSDFDEQDANARLIAAAPELLEACKQIAAMPSLKNASLGSDAWHAYLVASQAVSKATNP